MDRSARLAAALHLCRSFLDVVHPGAGNHPGRRPTSSLTSTSLSSASFGSTAGLSAEEMSDRIVYITERSLTTSVNNIEHIESQSQTVAVVKIFFQPHANINSAIAQVTAISQTQLRMLPPGTTPPLIISYNASTVPILQLGLSGQGLSEQQLRHSAKLHPTAAGHGSGNHYSISTAENSAR